MQLFQKDSSNMRQDLDRYIKERKRLMAIHSGKKNKK